MTPKQTTVYRCNRCGFLYRNQREAEECCPPAKYGHWDCGRKPCPLFEMGIPHYTEEGARRCAAKGEKK